MTAKPTARHNYPPEKFPLTLRLLSGKTGLIVWERTVTIDEARALAKIEIPSFLGSEHYPVRAEILYADGTTSSTDGGGPAAMSAASICCACSRPERPDREDPRGETELRPYGPNGALICFGCAMKPENRYEADRRFNEALDAAAAVSRADGASVAHVVLTPRGPRPLKTGMS